MSVVSQYVTLYLSTKQALRQHHLEVIRTVMHRCEAQLPLLCSLHSGFSPEVLWQDMEYARRERCCQDRLSSNFNRCANMQEMAIPQHRKSRGPR